MFETFGTAGGFDRRKWRSILFCMARLRGSRTCSVCRSTVFCMARLRGSRTCSVLFHCLLYGQTAGESDLLRVSLYGQTAGQSDLLRVVPLSFVWSDCGAGGLAPCIVPLLPRNIQPVKVRENIGVYFGPSLTPTRQ